MKQRGQSAHSICVLALYLFFYTLLFYSFQITNFLTGNIQMTVVFAQLTLDHAQELTLLALARCLALDEKHNHTQRLAHCTPVPFFLHPL
jgi:hypothetical protein